MDLFNSAEFTQHVNDLMEKWHTPGLAIAIVQGETVKSKGYGCAVLSEEGEQLVTGDTVFDIASSSKSQTAASVSILVNDDENYPDVKWDTPVSKLLPDDFIMSSDEYTKAVTVEDILSHRTGVPSHDFSYLSPRAQNVDTLQSVTRNLRNLEISAPIRTKFMYCNMMFTVAAYLVEQLSGLSFEKFLRQNFWKILGMNSTNLQSKNAIESGLSVARPYIWKEESNSYTPVERQYSPEAEGAGLIITSVNDYIKWVKALINQEHPVSKEMYDGLIKARSFPTTESDDDDGPFTSPAFYGAGLASTYYRGYQIVSHDGGDPGVASKHFFLPGIKFGGVILGNSATVERVIDVVARELIDEAIGVPHSERTDWVAWREDMIARDDKDEAEGNRERRRKLGQNEGQQPQPQQTPLSKYTGFFWNAGYHGVKVEINQKDKLFVDMTDRTMGFTLEFEHISDQTQYIAHSRDYYEGLEREIAAEFVFNGDEVMKLGLELEEDVESGRIWFEKVEDQDLPARVR